MASLAVVTAVQTLLAANWTATPIVGPNQETLVPDDGSAFLVLEFPPVGDETQITIGAQGTRIFREEGAILLTLCIPLGVGLTETVGPYSGFSGDFSQDLGQPIMQLFDDLRATFRGQSFSGVNTLGASPAHESGESDHGAYYELSSAISFYYDIQNA